MKKNTLANFIAFFIGIYFLIRAFFWYTDESGNSSQNNFFALIYFCVGILAITIQLIVNYIKKRKEK